VPPVCRTTQVGLVQRERGMCRIGNMGRGPCDGSHSHMVMIHTDFLIGTLRAFGVRRGMVV
jgi:hypothetical protein